MNDETESFAGHGNSMIESLVTEQKPESFFRRHRTAIVVTVITVVSSVIVGRMLSGNRMKMNAAESLLLDGMQAANSGRYPFGSDISPKIDHQFRTPVVETTTNTWWPSQTAAAEAFGIAQGPISRNAYGILPATSVKNLNFEFDYKVDLPNL